MSLPGYPVVAKWLYYREKRLNIEGMSLDSASALMGVMQRPVVCHSVEDHRWHPVTQVCTECNRRLIEWHAAPYGKGFACSQ